MRYIISITIIAAAALYSQSSYTLEWVDTTNLSSWDVGTGIVVSNSGFIYATGYQWNGADFDGVVLKYDDAGNVIRIIRIDIGTYEEPSDITIDNSGKLYVTGFTAIGYNYNYGIIKLDDTGSIEWVDTIPNGADPWAHAFIAYDGTECLYVTGNIVTPDLDIFIAKIDTAGNMLWMRTLDFGNDDDAMGITYDPVNNFVYIAGKSNNGASDDLFLAKLTTEGDTVWTKRIDFGDQDQLWDVATDNYGYVYATGLVQRNSLDIVVMKFSPENGNLMWQTFFDRNHDDYARSITLDDSGNIYVTGGSHNPANTDIIVLKFDQNHNLVWADTMDLGNNESARAIALNDNGDIFITGTCYISDRDIFTAKFRKQQTGVSEETISENITHLNAPTVQHHILKIDYRVDDVSMFNLVNSAGRRVYSCNVSGAGSLSFNKLKTGVYWAILETEKGVETRKIILVR